MVSSSARFTVFVLFFALFGGMAASASSFSLDLEPGWNHISGEYSFPVSDITDDCSLESYQGEQVWGYRNGWTHPDTLHGALGYYVRAASDCLATIDTAAPTTAPPPLYSGWNSIAPAEDATTLSDTWDCSWEQYNGSVFWHWQQSGWLDLDTGAAVNPRNGYFVRPQTSCTATTGSSGGNGGGGITPRIDYGKFDQVYVSPTGDYDAAGTKSDPWSVAAANDKTDSGTVVNFLEGQYSEQLEPPSGTAGNPVIFRSNKRYKASLQRQGGNTVNVRLTDTSHVAIQGFHIYPEEARWVYIDSSDHITVRDNYMERAVMDGSGGHPLDVVGGSSYIDIMNNRIETTHKHDMVDIDDSDHIRLIGNTLSNSGHALIGGKGTNTIIARGNVFANTAGRAGSIYRGERALMENNVISNSWSSPGSAAAASKWFRPRTIFRENRDFQKWGNSVEIWLYDATLQATDSRYYNNVFDDSTDYGYYRGEAFYLRGQRDDRFENLEFENNIFFRQGQDAAGQNGRNEQVRLNDLTDDAVLFDTNFFGASSGSPQVEIEGTTMSISDAESSYPQFITNSRTGGAPGFQDATRYNHQLSGGSPLIDAGRALTVAPNSGSGDQVMVEDSYYFFDGWDFPSETGDRIQVGDSIARITTIEGDTLHLDRSISWSAGDPIGLPWGGDAPDIGAYEKGARKQVIIEKSDFSTTPGEAVSFTANLVGMSAPQEVCWQFGDASGTCGRSVSHTYSDPGGYGIRVRALDSNGQYHWGTAYVVVNGNGLDFTTFGTMKEMANRHLCNGEDDPYTTAAETELYQEADGDWSCREP